MRIEQGSVKRTAKHSQRDALAAWRRPLASVRLGNYRNRRDEQNGVGWFSSGGLIQNCKLDAR